MNIFATGKSGTIGRHFSKSIHSIDFRQSDLHSELSSRGFRSGDSLIHSAGIVGTGFVSENVEYSRHINVDKALELARALEKLQAKRLVFVSSSHVYGFSDTALDERSQLSPNSVYAEQKLAAELALLDFASDSGISVSIVRVFSILGWESKSFTLGGKLRSIYDNVNGQIDNSQDVRDFFTPFQAASLIESLSPKEQLPIILNIGTGVGITIEQASREMFSSVGFDLSNLQFQHSSSNTSSIVANTELLKKTLGQSPPRFDAITTLLN